MTRKYVGCDLGGTNLRAGIVDPQTGQISHLYSTLTLAREGHDAVMARMGELIQQTVEASDLTRDEIGSIGIGVPGVLDLERGLTLLLLNLPGDWPEVPLRDTISEFTGLPTMLLMMCVRSPMLNGALERARVWTRWPASRWALASVVDWL